MASRKQARQRAEDRLVTALNNPRAVTDHDRGTLVLIESKFLDLATEIELHLEDSRLKSLALTNLEEALTWANKGIYTQGSRGEDMDDGD